jgi:hypothetical protein
VIKASIQEARLAAPRDETFTDKGCAAHVISRDLKQRSVYKHYYHSLDK